MSGTIEISIRAWVIVTYCPNFLFGQYTKSSLPFTQLDQSALSSCHLLPFSSSPFSSAAVPLSITITSFYLLLFSLYSTLHTIPRPSDAPLSPSLPFRVFYSLPLDRISRRRTTED